MTIAMSPSEDDETLGLLQTEALNSLAHTMDSLDTLELCEAFNREEAQVSQAVVCCLPTIASLVNAMFPRIRTGGRLIYVGAGNSARVGYMDCSELSATFSVDRSQFLCVIAGGIDAVIEAQEGAEDSEIGGSTALESLELTSNDIIIGISASGRTPFVLGALKTALKHRALTAGITNMYPSKIGELGINYLITALVGPEFLAGSTRLKAGSSAKQILNMISTCAMIKLGKTYKGRMIDLNIKNHKLKNRGRRILRQICNESSLYIIDQDGLPSAQSIQVPDNSEGDAIIDNLIYQCKGSVKLACAVAISGLSLQDAKHQLKLVNDNFPMFVQYLAIHKSVPKTGVSSNIPYFLAVDGGGTNCTISIATPSKIVGRATAGACNFNCVSLEEILNQIKLAMIKAVASIPQDLRPSFSGIPKFSKVWVGIAGLYDAHDRETLNHRLEDLFGVSLHKKTLILTSDGILLTSCIGIDDSVESGISMIAGTGSVATAFRKTPNGEVLQVGRTGGRGHLIGDQGSAFDLGKKALHAVLARIEQAQGDEHYQPSQLDNAILSKLNCDATELMSVILHSDRHPKLQIGDLAKVVTELGLRECDHDPEALDILKSSAKSLAQLVTPLSKPAICDPSKSSLILSGSLMNLSGYRKLVLDELAKEVGGPFKKIVVVDDASCSAAEFLAKQATNSNIEKI